MTLAQPEALGCQPNQSALRPSRTASKKPVNARHHAQHELGVALLAGRARESAQCLRDMLQSLRWDRLSITKVGIELFLRQTFRGVRAVWQAVDAQ